MILRRCGILWFGLVWLLIFQGFELLIRRFARIFLLLWSSRGVRHKNQDRSFLQVAVKALYLPGAYALVLFSGL